MSRNREKALYITPAIPDRYGVGVQQRSYRNLNLLTEQYQVDVIIVANNEHPLNLDDLNINSVTWLPVSFHSRVPKILKKVPGSFVIWRSTNLLLIPFRIINNTSKFRTVLAEFKEQKYSYALFFRIRIAWLHQFLLKAINCTIDYTTVDFDDIESIAKRRSLNITREKFGFQKYLSDLFEIKLIIRQEQRYLKEFDSVWVCSDIDKKKLEALPNTSAQIVAMPNTIYIPEQLPANYSTGSILLLGAMNYFPNVDAAQFFCKEVLPALRTKLGKSIQLYIVGTSPEQEVVELGEIEGVTVTGRVESVKDYYMQADIVIVPIRFGGGTRIKILEAMGYGRTVISTTIGAEGIEGINETEFIIANSADDYIEACLKYLEQPKIRHEIEANARIFVKENFGFDLAKEIFEREIKLKIRNGCLTRLTEFS
jgi:glycosyltransferase involved in cell wall biosynthesis